MFMALATLPDVQMRYRWTPDSVVIWDNRFTRHYACNDYGERRRHIRMTVQGEPVLGVRPRAVSDERVDLYKMTTPAAA